MKLISSSTARRRTAKAALRSFGGPHMPSPVRRIAPKPRRCTEISPPNETFPAAFAESSFLFIMTSKSFRLTLPQADCPDLLAYLQIAVFSSQATAGWRRYRRTGGSFYKARTAPLPRPLLFLPKAQQLGKNSSVENCGPPGEPAEESEASRTP